MREISHHPTEDDHRIVTDPDGSGPGTDATVCVALTVLYHPNLERVGERVRLGLIGAGQRHRLSRVEPIFGNPDGTSSGPLASSAVSRTPLVIDVTNSGAVIVDGTPITSRLRANGTTLQVATAFSRDDVEGGVVLELGARVVLLLHTLGPPPPAVPRGQADALGLIGESAGMARVRNDVLRVADLDVPVLIRGESGVGKELVAAAIHRLSPRSAATFVPVNMAAIPATTAASALFGHARGAFTGAVRPHGGYFGEADSGTLFLDEIGAAPLDVQAMLLRVLDTGEVQTVGSAVTRRVDVRIIAATDAALEDEVADGAFRLPLLHRLAGFQIHVPPLRDRRDDIARLALHYLRKHLTLVGAGGTLDSPGGARWLGPSVMARLCRGDWPGNVRQLINVTRQMVISSRGYDRLTLDPSIDELLPPKQAAPAEAAGAPARRRGALRPSQIDDDRLIAALEEHGWSMAATARALGIARSSLYLLVEQSQALRKANALSYDEVSQALDQADHDVADAASALRVSPHGLKMRARSLGLMAGAAE